MTDEQGNQGAGPEQRPPQRKGRGLRMALVVSLALNLLLAGFLAGGALRAWQAPAQPAMVEMRALWQVLPGETRQALRSEFRGRERAEQGMRGQVDTSPSLPGLLRADPFDADAFVVALANVRDNRAERAERAERALAQHLEALPVTERAAIAERLEERLERRARRDRPRAGRDNR
ncbi:MAG: periplasmic heavy metal sensor [Pararhodobacter sp.]|nr:periplasmic heavy metal sensor [Pararhodobacter sp.]